MIPFRFGAAGRKLHAIYHEVATRSASVAGVLICNPFGQEAVRTHRMFRVLADRLARAGVPVLRFDYFGTGDSDGDDTDGELEAWCADVVAADRELRRRARCEDTLWVGARLGATLAALASARAARPPRRLVLWEPVTSGSAYLGSLRADHTRALVDSFLITPEALDLQARGEVIGFAISERLEGELGALREPALDVVRAGEVVLLAPSENRPVADLARRLSAAGQRCRRVTLDHAFDWTSEEALNTALVPAAALDVVHATIALAGA